MAPEGHSRLVYITRAGPEPLLDIGPNIWFGVKANESDPQTSQLQLFFSPVGLNMSLLHLSPHHGGTARTVNKPAAVTRNATTLQTDTLGKQKCHNGLKLRDVNFSHNKHARAPLRWLLCASCPQLQRRLSRRGTARPSKA